MIVLKLGGSLITLKHKKFSFRRKVMERLAAEIGDYKGKLIIIHGGGSFGHPLAYEYGLNNGYEDERQIDGVVLTRLAMERLNDKVVSALLDSGIKAVSLQTSALAFCRGGEIERLTLEPVKRFLDIGITPVLYGDVVLDSAKGFCILSGDRIAVHLSRTLMADRAIMAIDKDGIFDRDPNITKGTKLLAEVNQHNYQEVLRSLGSVHGDVTGGITGKLRELWLLAEDGIESIIVNGLVPGRLQKALLGQEVKGTRIRVAP